MRVSFLFDENDFLNMQSLLRGGEIVSWFVIEFLIGCLGLVVGGISYWISDDPLVSLFLFVMVLLSLNLILFGLFLFFMVQRLIHARKNGLFGWIHINFTEHGFYLMRGQGFDHLEDHQRYFQAWSGVKGLRESKDYFFLSLGVGEEITIPKRAFTAKSEMDDFKELIRKRIPVSE